VQTSFFLVLFLFSAFSWGGIWRRRRRRRRRKWSGLRPRKRAASYGET
jgi:peptidoglycan/LPS O-acetylase OafA/YrhL